MLSLIRLRQSRPRVCIAWSWCASAPLRSIAFGISLILPGILSGSDYLKFVTPRQGGRKKRPAARHARILPSGVCMRKGHATGAGMSTLATAEPVTRPVIDATAPLPNGGLEVISIAKSYDKRAVLTDISLTVGKGEVLGLLGPNGAGKTTCFYSIMGLVRPDSGRILMDGIDVTKLPMYRRAILGLGYLPQETSIFRGMTVEQNINCVLEMVEPDKQQRAAELERLLDEFHLTGLRG